MFGKGLVPTDFSAYSQAVLTCISPLWGISEIVLLHIVDAAHLSRQGWTHAPHIANARILMGEDKYSLERSGFTVTTRTEVIREGSVHEAILEAARQEQVSMIIMGAKGESPTDLLLGSVSTTVLQNAVHPLMILKFRMGEEGGGAVLCALLQKLFCQRSCPYRFFSTITGCPPHDTGDESP